MVVQSCIVQNKVLGSRKFLLRQEKHRKIYNWCLVRPDDKDVDQPKRYNWCVAISFWWCKWWDQRIYAPDLFKVQTAASTCGRCTDLLHEENFNSYWQYLPKFKIQFRISVRDACRWYRNEAPIEKTFHRAVDPEDRDSNCYNKDISTHASATKPRYTLPLQRHSPGCESMGKVCLLPVDENILIALAFVAVVVLMFIAFLQPPPLRRRGYYC